MTKKTSIIFALLLSLLTCCKKPGSITKPEANVDKEFWAPFWTEKAKNKQECQYATPKLHAQNDYGYWGDLIPFYDQNEKKMYMYYMTGDTSDLANPKIEDHLMTSTDMFNYKNEEYVVGDNIKEAVNCHLYKKLGLTVEDFFDYKTFPDGCRDIYFFHDEQVNRYRYLVLCYYQGSGLIKCALGLGTSDDESGKTWTRPIKIIQNYPLFKQPECPCAQRINGRWYLFCSLWGESIHNVGRFRYLVGEEGKTLDEEEWLEKENYYLDGEDLCASQVCNVGNHYLMYGWIVKCYENSYFKKTIDNGLWGGAMSLMREVYQLSDGRLGVRLPYGLKDMFSKEEVGRITSGTITNANKSIEGNFSSSIIQTSITLTNSDDATLLLTANNKDYYVYFLNEEGRTNLYIGCDKDTGHPVAASYQCDKLLDKFDVTIIVEDNVLEVFFNNEYSLAARTSMFSGNYQKLSIEAKGSIAYDDILINKLATSVNVLEGVSL